MLLLISRQFVVIILEGLVYFLFFSFSYLENMLKTSFLKQVDRTYTNGFSRPKKFRDCLISQLSKDLFFESPNCILKTESFNSLKSVTSFAF